MNQPSAKPALDVCQDLGELLKKNPHLLRVHKIFSATMPEFLRLELIVVLVFHDPGRRHIEFVKINCLKAVDYAVRPRPPALIEGGRLVEHHEEHPRLQDVSQCVPHSDGMEYFKPPIQFKLLILEDTYVIAERFELFMAPV